MNTEIMKGKWLEVKGEILNKWGKLTDNELDQTKGNIASIAGLIQQHYGDLKEDVSEKISAMFERGKEAVAEKSEELKNKTRRADEFQTGSNPRKMDEFPPAELPEQPQNDPLLNQDTRHV